MFWDWRKSAMILLSSVSAAVSAGTLVDKDVIKTVGEVELAKWYGYRQYDEGPGDLAFSNALLRARAAHVPMLTVWSSPICHFCDGFAELLNTEGCRSYVASKNIVFAYFKSGDAMGPTPANPASLQAYNYTRELGIPSRWPYYRFEWVKPDGTVVSHNGTFARNIGTQSERVVTLEEFKALLESYLTGYDNRGTLGDYHGGYFPVADTSLSRLETVAGLAKPVWVPVRRAVSSTAFAYSQRIEWGSVGGDFAGGADLVWAEGEADKFARIEMPADLSVGSTVDVLLRDEGRQPVATARIHVIADSPADQESPVWIGEKTADELGWGEWTMDLDTATQKVAAAVANGTNAYTLALCGGELWCGDCKGTRKYLCETPEFKEWARTNHVALVLIDIPSSGTSPTMLSWDENASGVSGAYYLSRKGVDPDMAKSVFDRNHDLCYNIWYKEYENRSSHRVWVPTMVLLAGDGRPHGRLLGDRAYPNNPEYDAKGVVYTLDTYLLRLNELLLLADDPTEWDNNDWSTTEVRLDARHGEIGGTLSALDGNSGDSLHQKVIDVTEIVGCTRDLELTFAFAGDRPATVRAELTSVTGAEGRESVQSLGSVDFVLSSGCEWTVTNHVEQGRFFLSLRGDDDAFFAYNRIGGSVCNYSVSLDSALVCGEAESTVPVRSGALRVHVERGVTYVFSNVPFDFSEEFLTSLGDSRYRAKKDGVATLEFRESGLFAYQLWRTGRIAFNGSDVGVSERAGCASVSVGRQNGSSGTSRVRVSYSGGTARSLAEDPEFGSFDWPGDIVLEWPDGVATNQIVTFPVFSRSPRWEGDQTVVLDLEEVPGSSAGISDPSRCTVTIIEEDPRRVGKLEFVQEDAAFARKGIAYAKAGQRIPFSIVRVDGANTDVGASVSATGEGTVSPASARWLNNGADARRDFTLAISEAAVPGSVVTVRAVPDGISMKNGIDRFSVVVLDASAPFFVAPDGVFERELGVGVLCGGADRIEIDGGSACRVIRESGDLPPGVIGALDGDALVFGGKATAAGTYASTWRVEGMTAGGSTIPGGTVRVIFDVRPLKDICPSIEDEGFPGPVMRHYVGFAADETMGIRHVVRLSADSGGRMLLVVESSQGKSRLQSSGWTNVRASEITSKLAGDGMLATMAWRRLADGRYGFEGSLQTIGTDEDVRLVLFPVESAGAKVDPGVYTVDFAPCRVEEGKSGHAFLTIRVSGSKALYAGMLPDGRSFSGSSTVMGGSADFVHLPILKRTSSGEFRALLTILSGAGDGGALFWENFNHSVSDAVPTFWTRSDGMPEVELEAGGGYYRSGMDLESICQHSDNQKNNLYQLSLPDGVRHVLVHGANLRLLADDGNGPRVTFSLNRSTGVFSGKYEGHSFKGVLLPNWGRGCGGCGAEAPRPGPFKPFGVGTSYVPGKSGSCGQVITLDAVPENL